MTSFSENTGPELKAPRVRGPIEASDFGAPLYLGGPRTAHVALDSDLVPMLDRARDLGKLGRIWAQVHGSAAWFDTLNGHPVKLLIKASSDSGERLNKLQQRVDALEAKLAEK